MQKLKKNFPNWKMSNNLLILTALVTMILAWAVFAPTFYANVDEHNYARTAWKLTQDEKLTEEFNLQNLGGFSNDDSKYISKYNIGNSIWLAPATLISLQATFAMGLISYLLIILISREILKELKINKLWILGIILFPPFIYFSRTLLSELPAAMFITLSYLTYLRRDQRHLYNLVLGLSLGAAVIIRYNLALWAIIIIARLIYENKKELKLIIPKYWMIGIGALPFLFIFLLTNFELYGSYFASGYKFSGEEGLQLDLIFKRLPLYIIALNILYPFQFLISHFSKKPLVREVHIFSIITVLFYSFAGGFLIEKQFTDIIVGIRFFIPILPLILIHYFSAIENNFPKIKLQFRFKALMIVTLTSFLILLNIFLNMQHQEFLENRYDKYRHINNLVKEDTLFIGDEEDYMYLGEHLNSNFNDSGYLSASNIEAGTVQLLSANREIYLLEISYDTRTDRPTTNMIKLLNRLDESGNLEQVTSEENINIFKYNGRN